MAYKRTYDEYDGWDADEEFYEEAYRPRRHASAPAGGARRPERKRSPRRTERLGRSAMAAVLKPYWCSSAVQSASSGR